MDKIAENSDENPDFACGLFVCEKPGHEFVGAGAVRTDESTPPVSMDWLGE